MSPRHTAPHGRRGPCFDLNTYGNYQTSPGQALRDPRLSTQPQKYWYENQKRRQRQEEEHVAASQAALGRDALQGPLNPSQPLPQRHFSTLLFVSWAAQKYNPCCMSIPAPEEISRRQRGKESFPPKNPAHVSPGSSPLQLAVSSELQAVI